MYKDVTVDELLNFLLMIKQDHGGQTKVVCEWDSGYSMINDYAVGDGVLIFDVSNYGDSEVDRPWDSLPDCDLKIKPYMCDECDANPADGSGYLCPGCEAYREHQR